MTAPRILPLLSARSSPRCSWRSPASPAAAAPEGGIEPSSDLPGLIEDIVRKSTMSHSKVGLEVISLDDGRVVYASHAQDLLNPASNTKIFTSAAALSRLGSDYRWVTEVYVDSHPVECGVLRGPLTIRGKGDPTLTSERLWEIALELWHQGLREVKGDLVLDDSYFDQVFEGPGWDQDRTDRAYMAPISALAINFGSFGIYVTPGDHAGAKANVEIEPMSPYFKLENKVSTVAHRKRLRHLADHRSAGLRRLARGRHRDRPGGPADLHALAPGGGPDDLHWRDVQADPGAARHQGHRAGEARVQGSMARSTTARRARSSTSSSGT